MTYADCPTCGGLGDMNPGECRECDGTGTVPFVGPGDDLKRAQDDMRSTTTSHCPLYGEGFRHSPGACPYCDGDIDHTTSPEAA